MTKKKNGGVASHIEVRCSEIEIRYNEILESMEGFNAHLDEAREINAELSRLINELKCMKDVPKIRVG